MNLKKILLPLMVFLAIGCSSDDSGLDSNLENLKPVNFTVIGEDANSVRQFSYTTSSDDNIDLTNELGVGTNYLTLRQKGELISFYSFSNGFFSLAQKNITTGQSAKFDNFYAAEPERSVIWGVNTEEQVFFGYFDSSESRNLSIFDLDLNDSSSTDTRIDFNINAVFQPVLFDDKVYVCYQDGQGNYKLTFYDIPTKSIGPRIDFGNIAISFLIDSSGQLIVVRNGSQPTLEIRDNESLLLLEELSFEFGSSFDTGPINGAEFFKNKLFYQYAYPQPARIPNGPAFFDFSQQKNQLIDVSDLVNSVETDSGASISFTTQIYDSDNELFLMGYGIIGSEVSGGVLQVSTSGNLIANIEFPFFPTYIVRD